MTPTARGMGGKIRYEHMPRLRNADPTYRPERDSYEAQGWMSESSSYARPHSWYYARFDDDGVGGWQACAD